MSSNNPPESRQCDACGGSGQLNFFKGESRFLLTGEECPLCNGFGYLLPEEIVAAAPDGEKARKGKGKATSSGGSTPL